MKTITLFISVIVLASAFKISTLAPEASIFWPFTICEKGPWTLSELLLDQHPSKNINLTAIAVRIFLPS